MYNKYDIEAVFDWLTETQIKASEELECVLAFTYILCLLGIAIGLERRNVINQVPNYGFDSFSSMTLLLVPLEPVLYPHSQLGDRVIRAVFGEDASTSALIVLYWHLTRWLRKCCLGSVLA